MTKNDTKSDLVGLGEYCETHGVDVKRARRACRAGTFGDAVQIFGKFWGCPSGMDVPELPEPGTRGASRADGRKRYVVYVATDAELTAVRDVVGDANVVNPRDVAKQRRDAKRDAATDMDNVDG